MLNQNSIAIIGSRNATPYGKKYTAIFAKELARAGITIISGLAIGIDTIAHINSMNEIGKTIAILGSGFNNIYPKQNYYLYNQIIQNGGCVISEYPPESEVNKSNFPKRNRIISGISMGILIAEARYRSGTTITAKYAIKQNKAIFCIPNKLDEPTGYSTNQLIKNGANLVTSAQDILDFYNLQEENFQMEEKYKIVYQFIGELPISSNELSKITNLSISEVTEALCILEIEGFITLVSGSKYVRS